MNQTGGKAPSTPRLSEYATNALEKIRKELRMFSIGDVHNISNSSNGQTHTTPHNAVLQNQVECDLGTLITHLMNTGYTEEQAIAFIKSNSRSEIPGIFVDDNIYLFVGLFVCCAHHSSQTLVDIFRL